MALFNKVLTNMKTTSHPKLSSECGLVENIENSLSCPSGENVNTYATLTEEVYFQPEISQLSGLLAKFFPDA